MESEFKLKPLHARAIPHALEKVEQYRLLNEPREAESICLDVLEADPGNQEALVQLILSLTDQFGAGGFGHAERQALELVPRLEGEYEKIYYRGIIAERRAKAQLEMRCLGEIVYHGLREAMELYEQAEELAPEGNEDAVLRWNTCARVIMAHPELEPGEEDPGYEPYLE